MAVIHKCDSGGAVYVFGLIGAAFEKIMAWAHEMGLVGDDTLVIGVSHDDPGVVPMEECRYDACVTVPAGTASDGDVGVYKIQAGRYAVCAVSGSYEKVGEELEKAYGDLIAWWPTSGFEVDERPWLEPYVATKEECEAGRFVADICVPIKGE